MRVARVLSGLAAAVLGLAAAVLVGRTLWRRETARHVDELHAAANVDRDRTFTTDDLEGLPDPVRRYLGHVLREGQPYAGAVRLEQEGTVRGDAASPWRPFVATEYVTVDPPGFLWDATIEVGPLVSLNVRDLFRGGSGSARVSLLSVLPVDSAGSSPELNAGELMRYLAEAVWYPTALLPGEGVEWEPIDDSAARATLEHEGTRVSLVFRFDDRNVVTRVEAEERYRRVDGAFVPTPWSGYWRDYRTRDGVRVPTEGEVVWHLPDGHASTWRGRLTGIERRPTG